MEKVTSGEAMTAKDSKDRAYVCELCGTSLSDGKGALRRHHKDHFDRSRQLLLISCASCGMTYLNEKFVFQEEPVGYVSDPEFTKSWGDQVQMHRYEIERFVRYFNKQHPGTESSQKLHLLEFGFGTGSFLRQSVELNKFDVVGVEKDVRACSSVRKSLGIPVFETLSEAKSQFGQNYFDLIYSAHTLEHIVNLKGVLRQLNSLLKPGGLFVIIVPFFSKLAERFEAFYLDHISSNFNYSLIQNGHINYLTPKTLGRYLEEAGFSQLVHVPGIYGEETLRNIGLQRPCVIRSFFRLQEILFPLMVIIGGALLLTMYASKQK